MALGFCLSLVACGGGGGGSPTEPPAPTPRLTFTPSGSPVANSAYLATGATSTITMLFLEVRVQQVTDLFGIAFDLTYPSAVLRYAGVVEGDLLRGGGASTNLLVSEPTPGRLVVGLSRLGAVAGASGSGVVATIQLTALASGGGSFAFADNACYDSYGARQSGVTWLAGSVEVVR